MFRKLLLGLLIWAAASATALFVWAAPREGGNKYALLIGVRDYLPSELHKLPYTDNDIADLAKVLIEQGGYRAEQVIVMTQKVAVDQRKPQLHPSAANIRKQLEDILKLCEEEDSLLMAFAGHSVQFKDSKDNYFCPADAKLSDKKTLISLGELYRSLGAKEDLEKYVKTEVKAFVKSNLDDVQRPQLVGASNEVWELVHVRAREDRSRSGDIGEVRREPARAVAPFDKAKAKELQRAWAKHLDREVVEEVDLGGGVTMAFVLIPPGKFLMGSPEDEKDREENEVQHAVEITQPFYLGKYEVTRGQFRQFVRDAEYTTEAERDGKGGWGWNADKKKFERNTAFSWTNAGFQSDNHPVVNVTWNDAAKFCRWLAQRSGKAVHLPSEAEWEYACRAGTETPFHFGKTLNGDKANCDGNSPYGTDKKGIYLGRTCAVGSYAANAFGLHDMHGNVWEWCQDYYGLYEGLSLKDTLKTEKVDKNARVFRGGSYLFEAWVCRAACRFWRAPGARDADLGFRVAFRLD
jgi:formylglycine-generating enzyme required for sulfatase activity